MNEKKDVLDVIDEMLEKIDNCNENSDDFKNELDKKLNDIASEKGFSDFNSMINLQVSNNEVNLYIKNAIDNVDYDEKHNGLYKEGHQEALNKYFNLIKKKNMDELKKECKEEERSINRLSSIRDEKLNGYKDGLYLFNIILEDALNQGKNNE
ncbi:MAG: hypothetical protein MR601_00345 [Erysipelotrichaceae bacterium]|nr:hypothetical protein [Erysipelotrichaceae bacterium]